MFMRFRPSELPIVLTYFFQIIPIMELNPHYDEIGKTFVQQYYACFDDPTQRASLAVFYNVRDVIH